MIYWYCGLGIAHRTTWDATQVFHEDLWKALKLPEELLDPLDLADMDLDYIESDNSESECDSMSVTGDSEDGEATDEELDSENGDEVWETDSEADIDIGLDEDSLDDMEDKLDSWCDEDDNENGEGVMDDVESLGYSLL